MLLSGATVACARQQTGRDPKPVGLGPGHLVAIGDGRTLSTCAARGRAARGSEGRVRGNSNDWCEVQGPLGHATRTCAYGPAGLGSSLPIPMPRLSA